LRPENPTPVKRGQVLPETVTGNAFERSVMLKSEQGAEECETIGDDSSTKAGQTKKNITF